jgi:hypothetical protein
MKTQWKKVWLKATVWLAAEIVLNWIGIDNLADYSEFVFDKEVEIAGNQPKMTVVAPSHPVASQLIHRFIVPVRA